MTTPSTKIPTRRRSRPTVEAGRILWPVVIAVAAMATIVLLRPKHDSPATVDLREVSRSDLRLEQRRLYRAGENDPFTGFMVEHYATGALKSRSMVSDGLLHGLSQGWHTNGQIQVTEPFKQGVSHGRRTKWHANGNRQSEVMIVEGKLEGTFRRWREEGTLAEQVELKADIPHGVSLGYFPSGSLRTRATLENGNVVNQDFFEDGEVNLAITVSR